MPGEEGWTYEKEAKIGEGTFAVVYRGWANPPVDLNKRSTNARKRIAIKKIKLGWKDGIDISAVREIKYLQELKHPNLIEVS
jgi:cyclin-dependent kinase 7